MSSVRSFTIAVGPETATPGNREVRYSLSLNGADQAVTLDTSEIVSEHLLHDPDELPWLVAHVLRHLMVQSRLNTSVPQESD
jgi:hypothetical protein